MGFLNDITLGQYYPGKSFLHRLDPRSKIITSLIFTTCLILANEIWLILLLGIICLIGLYLADIPLSIIGRNLKPFYWLFLITFVIHLFTTEGRILVNFGILNITVTEQGLLNGISYSTRLAVLIVFAALLTMTTSPIDITDSLEKMLAPLKSFKVPVHEFTLMITLSLRFIPILLREAERIQNAQLSRGASLEGNLIQRVKNIIPMVLPLFISAFRRADELAQAMEARVYVGGHGRTNYQHLVFKRGDFVLLAFSGIFGCVFFFLR